MHLSSIITSPLRRTLETANIFADLFGIDKEDIKQDMRLSERDCRPYLGEKIVDVFAKDEKELIAGGMEPLDNLYKRSKEFYNELLAQDIEGAILLVGHSGNLTPLIAAAKDAALGEMTDVPPLALDDVLRLY